MSQGNSNLLKAKLFKYGVSVSDLSDMFRISKSCVYKRLSSPGTCFKLREVMALGKLLNLSCEELTEIFFTE